MFLKLKKVVLKFWNPLLVYYNLSNYQQHKKEFHKQITFENFKIISVAVYIMSFISIINIFVLDFKNIQELYKILLIIMLIHITLNFITRIRLFENIGAYHYLITRFFIISVWLWAIIRVAIDMNSIISFVTYIIIIITISAVFIIKPREFLIISSFGLIILFVIVNNLYYTIDQAMYRQSFVLFINLFLTTMVISYFRYYFRIKNYLMTKEIELQKEKIELALEGGKLGYWHWNIKTGETEVDDRYLKILGYKRGELVVDDTILKRLIHPQDKELMIDAMKKNLTGQTNNYEAKFRLKTKSGSWKWISSIGRVSHRGEDGSPIKMIGVHQDIQKEKERERNLKKHATYDKLTGVYNRRVGLNILKEKIKIAKRDNYNLTIAFIDINDLKIVNDFSGHLAGDELIKTVTTTIESNIREVDSICRMGGDEFLIIFPKCSIKGAENIWKRIVDKFEEINKQGSLPYKISVSYGLSQYQKGVPLDIDKLIAVADRKMYQEKRRMKRG
ncbi:sensor domain-containing diguanylate cyclase [Halonatronum saccharophilum]|uniref:sensor domain-containing diguanylate cyclase n=1 Tax=Halonatronum saccharophilum TaxID=150060 RepID=UPI0004856BF9|nr:sensor domain-containing diguanylate cyclase [Halonatronum saccharophilum]